MRLRALGLALALACAAWPAFAAPDDGVRLAPATPGAVRFTVTVPPARLSPVTADGSAQALSIAGYGTGSPDATPTALPGRLLLVAVPPLGDVRLTAAASEASVRESVTLAAWPGASAEASTTARRIARASLAEPAAPAGARLLDVTWMRNQRVARVLVTPVAYDAAAQRLTVASRVDVELAVTNPGPLDPPAEPADPFEPVYRSSIVNYEQGRSWRRPRADVLLAAAKRSGTLPQAIAAITALPDTSVYVGRTWIKIAVQKSGFYAVNFSRLRGLSLFSDANPAPLDSLRLFTWPGKTVLPEDSYCDSCDYREVAIGFVRDVGPPVTVNGVSVDGPADGLFSNNNDAFYFYAQGADGWESDMDATRPDTNYVDHPYERNNFYYLTVATHDKPVTTARNPQTPLRIGASPDGVRDVSVTGGETPVATVPGRLHLEQDSPSEYWPDASAIHSTLVWEKWFWRSLTSGQSFSHVVDVPDADTTQSVRFRLRAWGLSDSRQSFEFSCSTDIPDHLLDVSFNSLTFPTRGFDGQTAASHAGVTFDTTGVLLRRTGNTVSVSVPTVPFISTCPQRLDRCGLAFYELYYQRFLQPAGDAIDFRTAVAAGRFQYDVGPFVKRPSTYVFDITQPLRPVMLLGGSVSAPDTVRGPFTFTFADSQSVSHRYAIVPDSILQNNAALIPTSQLSDAPFTSLENLRSAAEGADYLVIYFDGFKTAADSLMEWRKNHLPLITTPAETKGVPISAVFDQFSGGRTDPGAIRSFLRAASGWSRRPLYVLFLGDASFDFKDITGRALPGQPGCVLPTFENSYDGSFAIRRQYATDDWLVNVDDPVVVLPDYLSGRIPADDPGSALEVVTTKILGYERRAPFGEYRNSAVLMADDDAKGLNDDPIGWLHVEQTDSLDVNHTPLQIDREYVYLHTFPSGPGGSKPGARVELQKDLNAGTSLFNFVGHGSPFKMTDESVFLDSDAGTLTNGLKMPLMVSASCDVGKFNDPAVQSLGERMFMQPNGGCIGVISATEQSLTGPNAALNTLLYDALFSRDTIRVAGRRLDTNGQFHLPPSAALLAAKSRQFGSNANDEKFQLMGDPGTALNLPRLWTELRLTDGAGQPVTQIARGQTVHFSGSVLDRPGGSVVPIDGAASVLIEDSAPLNSTPGPPLSTHNPVQYRFSAGPMYHGDVSVHGGAFAGQFVVPLDATAGPDGRVRAYVAGNPSGGPAVIDGSGSAPVTIAPGSVSSTDVTGPRITLTFLGGSTNVHADATLQIILSDDSGIMTTAHAPQNSIIVTVDGNTTSRTDVTSTFRYAADSYQSGTATFQLPNLAPGAHTVKVSAADNLATGLDAGRHRSSETIDFSVSETPPLRVARTYLFPDPVRSGGAGAGGVFIVDAPGDPINTLVRIYTVAGRLVRALKQFGGQGEIQMAWDGLDDEGDPLAQGTYLYKVYVNGRDADGSSSPRQKATAEGRFVVLNTK